MTDYTCTSCGESFQTLTKKRIHQRDCQAADADLDVVESVSDGRRKVFRLNVAGLERIIQNHRKRQKMAEFRAELEDSQ